MARTPDFELHSAWRDRIRRQASSGLTIARFCAQEGVSQPTFHSWKRRLRLADLTETRPTSAALPPFLPVTVCLPQQQAHGEPTVIVADLPNGVRLSIPTGDARLACRIVRAVACARTDTGGLR